MLILVKPGASVIYNFSQKMHYFAGYIHPGDIPRVYAPGDVYMTPGPYTPVEAYAIHRKKPICYVNAIRRYIPVDTEVVMNIVALVLMLVISFWLIIGNSTSDPFYLNGAVVGALLLYWCIRYIVLEVRKRIRKEVA